ncbi:MAG: ATP-binding protein, partial [bacterium]|nr:ATP-binding protein [Candidatus Colisoma equi]
MLAKCYSGAINGADARMVEIEVYSTLGTSQFAIVGLPDTAVKEAKDRIPKALKSQGLSPSKEYDVTVNLAPADVRKEGSIYDLPIAVGLLGATGRIRNRNLDEYGLIGELALSGEVRAARGVLPMVMEMRRVGLRAVIVPHENVEEASVVGGIDVIPVKVLQEAVQYLNGERTIEPCHTDLADLVAGDCDSSDDFADVEGQA